MRSSDPRPELYWVLFVLVQHLSRRMDERLTIVGLTSRQWLLLAVLGQFFPESHPTLTEAAERYGTSRQNVKQIAAGLERRGWVRIEPDPNDGRVSRLVLTERIAVFETPALTEAGDEFLRSVFAGTSELDLAQMRDLALGLLRHLEAEPSAEEGSPP